MVRRFRSADHYAAYNGTAPREMSSAARKVHRLSLRGKRQLNHAIHIAAVTQIRHPHSEGRAYYDRKIAAGKSSNEAMRCLKRRLSDIVYRTMLNDLVANKATGPGGHRGASLQSSAVGSHPHTGSSDKSLPGPVKAKPKTPLQRAA